MNIWGRLGISVAIVAAFSILMNEVLRTRHFYEVYRWGICAGLLGMGVFLWIVGKFVNARLRQSKKQVRDEWAEEGQQEEEPPSDPFILVNLAYWGMILTIFGLIVIVIVPYEKQQALTVAAATASPPVETKPPPVTNAAPELVVEPPAPKRPLPNLKLQGIVHKISSASALINGRTYFVGETVSNATVVAIKDEKAVLELDGQTMILELPR